MSSDGRLPASPPLFLTDKDVEALSSWTHAIDAIRAAYSKPESAERTPGRIFAQSPREWIRVMPSVPEEGKVFGTKSIVGSFGDELRVSYLISLFDKETADLVALVDGNRVTGLRTAATTAVGTEAMTPARPLIVGVIGSGFEARSHLTALATLRDFAEVRVFSPTPANREAFARDFDALLDAPVTAVASAQAAAEGADLILCAARSRDESPTVQARWIGANATVVSIGSTTPAQRELPADLIARAAVVVADAPEEVVHGSGDLIAARKEGVDVDALVVPLSAVLLHKVPIDLDAGIRIYKSTGSGLQDIVVAEMLYDRARNDGYGYDLPVSIVTTKK
ncbi:hypothetical protein KZX45_16265 [Georgenia sp. EYE_87]|uniref:ornithine cyclodeaminase family protein n=1 Tax=Georgenia sp. EYE_87 TaxID=2853448 RepID=UPI002004A577|nr:hypothetical protein [Georgenia sp. EYE_87]MCK6212099.1 hypothetical protein [Georgenia sp. EYE_87]